MSKRPEFLQDSTAALHHAMTQIKLYDDTLLGGTDRKQGVVSCLDKLGLQLKAIHDQIYILRVRLIQASAGEES